MLHLAGKGFGEQEGFRTGSTLERGMGREKTQQNNMEGERHNLNFIITD